MLRHLAADAASQTAHTLQHYRYLNRPRLRPQTTCCQAAPTTLPHNHAHLTQQTTFYQSTEEVTQATTEAEATFYAEADRGDFFCRFFWPDGGGGGGRRVTGTGIILPTFVERGEDILTYEKKKFKYLMLERDVQILICPSSTGGWLPDHGASDPTKIPALTSPARNLLAHGNAEQHHRNVP